MAAATTVPPKVETNKRRIEASYNGIELANLIRLPAATADTALGNYFSVSYDSIANMSTSYDYLFKVLLCGDCGVGKTSMLRRYVSDEMNDAYIATVGKLC